MKTVTHRKESIPTNTLSTGIVYSNVYKVYSTNPISRLENKQYYCVVLSVIWSVQLGGWGTGPCV